MVLKGNNYYLIIVEYFKKGTKPSKIIYLLLLSFLLQHFKALSMQIERAEDLNESVEQNNFFFNSLSSYILFNTKSVNYNQDPFNYL